jgi:uncharacterized protein YpmB
MLRKRRAQSILEYVIVLTVIITAIIVAANQFIKPAVNRSLESVETSVRSAVNNLPGVD